MQNALFAFARGLVHECHVRTSFKLLRATISIKLAAVVVAEDQLRSG